MATRLWENHLRASAAEAEREFQRGVSYINESLVPAIRAEAKLTLRLTSAGLRHLADTLDRHSSPAARPAGKQP